jgi:hypothetical protein
MMAILDLKVSPSTRSRCNDSACVPRTIPVQVSLDIPSFLTEAEAIALLRTAKMMSD